MSACFQSTETLSADLAVFDGAVPGGPFPVFASDAGWGSSWSSSMCAVTLYRGCQDTIMVANSFCGGGFTARLVYDTATGTLIGKTWASDTDCSGVGVFGELGCDAQPPCETLCGWPAPYSGCPVPSDAGADASDASPE